ncbi:MAG: DNA-deoxyinosine glycosylase [Rhodospirillales bacterium]
MRKRGLAPLIDARAETLVLGSFPSVASLAACEYYAHPQNHFWKIVAAQAGLPATGVPYAERVRAVQGLRIAVWDVVAACEREGSGDERIENARLNDFSRLITLAPRLRRVCFNGKAAEKTGRAAVRRYAVRHLRAAFHQPAQRAHAACRENTAVVGGAFGVSYTRREE